VSYLFDTCVLSEEIKKRPDARVNAWAKRELAKGIFVSAVSLVEIRYGIERMALGRRRSAFQAWFHDQLVPFVRPGLVAVDEEVALRCGAIMAEQPNAEVPDALIAATALVHGLVVATRNVKHFVFDGLVVFNPWKGGS
jgi:predicted nucleic acid-binding protein